MQAHKPKFLLNRQAKNQKCDGYIYMDDRTRSPLDLYQQ